MKLEIVDVIDRGVPGKERLWLKANAATNLQYYIVFDTTYTSENSISNIQRHAHWFVPKPVSAGDYVVLYTGKGTKSETKNTDGTTTHFLFWGIDRTIWNVNGDCAVLFEVSNWMTSKYIS